MIHYVYILQSESSGRYYCGLTSDLERRVSQHNDPDYHGSLTTKRFAGPWQVVYTERSETLSEAVRRERQIKGRGVKRFLEHVQKGESRLGRD